jgi:transcriptional regulator with XRE-family HTH domain
MMLEYDLGAKLKKLRLAKKITLQALANEIGFSSALISQIENNHISPPIATLSKLAKYFDVKMSYLFSESNEELCYEVIKKDNRKVIPHLTNGYGTNHDYSCESFSFKKLNKKMEPFLITLNEKLQADKTVNHNGESFLFVLEGTLAVLLDGRQIILKDGDSVYFDATIAHGYHSTDGAKVKILEVCCGD